MEDEPSLESLEKSESQEIADILQSFGAEHGFDDETCQEIAVMDFPEAFETAYGYLTQAGLDPDEVLALYMEEPVEEE